MSSKLSRRSLWLFVVFNTLFLSGLLIWIYQNSLPRPLVVPPLASGKVACVSYAPYHFEGQSPFIKGMWVSHEQIEADLEALSRMSHCVRTYSVGQGMDYVPEAAAKLGLKVYLGAWIGWTDADNLAEINLAMQRANAYPDTVKALIIGNEVLLRKEQNEDAMRRYLRLAKKQTQLPVTYADVWEYWLKHASLSAEVNFITVHILPYWEDIPVAVEEAPAHIRAVMAKLSERFDKPVLIGETGWPSVGRQRQGAAPSRVNEARYLREFLLQAAEHHWNYNLIEAIDQPWKRALEGTVGGYWGILDANMEPKFSWDSPVSERDDVLTLSIAGGMGLLMFIGIALKNSRKDALQMMAWGIGGMTLGIMFYLQTQYLIVACRDALEWLGLGLMVVIGVIMAYLLLDLIGMQKAIKIHLMGYLNAFVIMGLLVTNLLMVFDGRYRDFPMILFLLPAWLVVVLHIWQVHWRMPKPSLWIWVGLLNVGLSIVLTAMEPKNVYTWYWLCLNTLFFASAWFAKHMFVRATILIK